MVFNKKNACPGSRDTASALAVARRSRSPDTALTRSVAFPSIESKHSAPSPSSSRWLNRTSASIASYTAGGPLGLVVPLPAVPSVGDAFSIYPGCSKTLAACQAYGNSNKFRGCPFVPPAESGL